MKLITLFLIILFITACTPTSTLEKSSASATKETPPEENYNTSLIQAERDLDALALTLQE